MFLTRMIPCCCIVVVISPRIDALLSARRVPQGERAYHLIPLLFMSER
jgi:hypothetical protein